MSFNRFALMLFPKSCCLIIPPSHQPTGTHWFRLYRLLQNFNRKPGRHGTDQIDCSLHWIWNSLWMGILCNGNPTRPRSIDQQMLALKKIVPVLIFCLISRVCWWQGVNPTYRPILTSSRNTYIQVAAPIGSKITLNSLSSVSCCQNVAPDVSVPNKKGANKKH